MKKNNNNTYIRTSKHFFSALCGKEKLSFIHLFLTEYRKAIQTYIDFLWSNKLVWTSSNKTRILDIQNDLLDCPSFISTININIQSSCSARALKCASTQACSIIKGLIERRKKLLYVKYKLEQDGQDTIKINDLLDKTKISKPTISNSTPAELNSICANFKELSHFFNGFLQLSSLGKDFGKIRLPVKYTKHSNKLSKNGKLLNSFLVSENYIEFRYEIPKPETKKTGKTVGADSGKLNVLTFSDGQQTIRDKDGHDLASIQAKLARKQKGSKGFKKAQDHRKNYINWSINQLNFSDFREVKLEQIYNLRKGKRTSREGSHFTYTLIENKLTRLLEEIGVQLTLNKSYYRSQRCSCCAYVYKSNRKGKEYSCERCGFKSDSDLNAALNNEIELPNLEGLYHLDSNSGFFWKESGIYNLDGSEITVPEADKR